MSVSIDTDQTSSATEATAAAAPKIEAAKIETPAIDVPKVEAPKADLAQAEIKSEATVESRVISITSAVKSRLAARPRASRYAVLAASIAIAAALGSVVGALAGAALMRSEPEASAPTMNANALNKTLAQLSADMSAMKSALDANSKAASAQIAKVTERVDRTEKSQAESLKSARLTETVKPSSPETTGSIVEKLQARPPIVEGWVIRDVFDGRAMVEGRSGIYEVGPGVPLPGVGRVEAVRRQDGRWVVVTPKGLIVSSRQ